MLKLEEPAKDGHSQLGAIFAGESGSIQILRGDYIIDRPELKKAGADKGGAGSDAGGQE